MRAWIDRIAIEAEGTALRISLQIQADQYDPVTYPHRSTSVNTLPPEVRSALLLWLTTGGPAEPPDPEPPGASDPRYPPQTIA